MRIERRSCLAGAEQARGLVVVIDVLRAFTCAALMFNYGIEELVLVATPEEALDFRTRDPRYLVAGEVKGLMVNGFDLGNSPREIVGKGEQFLKGRKVVLRSTAGTQGAIAVSRTADEIILGSYTNASAIARYIRKKDRDGLIVTLLGMGAEGKRKSTEDECCADYIEHLLTSQTYDHLSAIWGCLLDPFVGESLSGRLPHLPKEDVVLSLQRDLFDFVMVGKPANGSVNVQRIQAGGSPSEHEHSSR